MSAHRELCEPNCPPASTVATVDIGNRPQEREVPPSYSLRATLSPDWALRCAMSTYPSTTWPCICQDVASDIVGELDL